MLYFLSELRHIFGPLRLFEYITFRAGAAAFTAFLIVVLLGSWTARKLRQLNMQAASRYEGILPPEMIDKEKEKTPLMTHSDGSVIVAATGMDAYNYDVMSIYEDMVGGKNESNMDDYLSTLDFDMYK